MLHDAEQGIYLCKFSMKSIFNLLDSLPSYSRTSLDFFFIFWFRFSRFGIEIFTWIRRFNSSFYLRLCSCFSLCIDGYVIWKLVTHGQVHTHVHSHKFWFFARKLHEDHRRWGLLEFFSWRFWKLTLFTCKQFMLFYKFKYSFIIQDSKELELKDILIMESFKRCSWSCPKYESSANWFIVTSPDSYRMSSGVISESRPNSLCIKRSACV